MDITTLTTFGRGLQARLRTFLDAPAAADATPLEIARAALDDVERHVAPAAAGRRVFPFTRVRLRVRAPEDAWPAIGAVLDDFEVRVRARLAEVRCEAPRGLETQVTCESVGEAGPGFVVEYERAAAPAVVAPPLHVTVLRGASPQSTWTFTDGVALIGRVTDASAHPGQVSRTHLAFADTRDGVTETVGRLHARIRFDATAGAYRVYDEGSHNGTSIQRDGEVIAVPRRDPRGARLRSGDQLQIGRALLGIEIG